ncbi:MAG: serpin family protein [Clostridia bacterium]
MKKSKIFIIAIILIAIVVVGCVLGLQYFNKDNKNEVSKIEENEITTETEVKKMSEYRIEEGISNFDLAFLKIENPRENMIYSPLSIKYALGMLEEAAEGKTKEEIANILSDYQIKEYTNSKNMTFGNALFVRDTFNVRNEYKTLLEKSYNADVITDSFQNGNTINKWVSEKTLNLINDIVDDDSVKNLDFALVNALGIDMEWNNKFFMASDLNNITDENIKYECDYSHINNTNWMAPNTVSSSNFNNKSNKISGMEIYATLNNYDIINDLGEEYIRKTVTEEFTKWAKGEGREYEDMFNGDYSDENIAKQAEKYLDGSDDSNYTSENGYLKELASSYKDVSYSTDFSLYVDDDVKMFAKDLKEYDGTTLEYIAIMPTNDELEDFIENTTAEEIKDLISNLKELKLENFNDGVITEISGYIPKFKFEYDLNLIDDLNKMGIEKVFKQEEAELANLCEEDGTYISNAKHKANIEFTQDGIKASAATMAGGLGAGSWFDYIFDVPIEKIDLTFDKPYMFLIRDKSNGEIWFAGNVYEPLSWDEDETAPEFEY